MHPGWTETVGARTAMGRLFDRMDGKIRSLPQGSDTATWLSLQVRCVNCCQPLTSSLQTCIPLDISMN